MMPMADPRVFIGINFFQKKTKLYNMKTLVRDDNILLEDSVSKLYNDIVIF